MSDTEGVTRRPMKKCILWLCFFVNIKGYSDPGFDSLSTAVNSPFPDVIQMDLQVFRSNRPEQVTPFIEEVSGLISQTSSYQFWSNAVEKVTRDVIFRNEKKSGCVLNYRFQKSGLNVRIDSIEDLSGRKEELSSLDFPTQTHLRRRKSAQSPVEIYSLSPYVKAARVSGRDSSIPFDWVEGWLEHPPSIKIIAALCLKSPSEFAFGKKNDYGRLQLYEMRINSSSSVRPLLQVVYDSATSKWLGVFLLNPNGGVTSAAVASVGLGRFESENIFIQFDKYPIGDKGEIAGSAVVVKNILLDTVDPMRFEPVIPSDWLVVDERTGKATQNGVIVGDVGPIDEIRQPDSIAPTKRLLMRSIMLLAFVVLPVCIFFAVKKRNI
jgi:hypothetical protein